MIALGSVLRQLLRGGEVGPSACGLTALAPFGSAVLSLLTLQTRNSFAGGWMCRRQKFAGSPLREMAKFPSQSVIRGYLHARTYRRPRARTHAHTHIMHNKLPTPFVWVAGFSSQPKLLRGCFHRRLQNKTIFPTIWGLEPILFVGHLLGGFCLC